MFTGKRGKLNRTSLREKSAVIFEGTRDQLWRQALTLVSSSTW